MSVDPSILAVLRNAVAADPANHALRLHLAETLAEGEETAEAFAEAEAVLAAVPDHLDALRLAAATGAALDHPKAEAYTRLLQALGGSTSQPPAATPEPPSPPTPAPLPATGTVPDTVDDLLESWGDTPAATEPEIGQLGRPSITLADVGGLAEVKARLDQSFLLPMRNPQLQAQFGKSLRGGLLLWGPPGCGKTYLARAVAGELGANFYEVGLADVLDMWIGASERNLRSIFDVARTNTPCVLFFDEIDALGIKRTQLRGGGTAMRGIVNQLLTELDGVTQSNEGVFVLGATNHPWDLDPALVRPGRFDRKVLVLPPDLAAREAILATHLRDRPTERLDLAKAAQKTDGFSGADLALVAEQATELALTQSVRSGTVQPITQKHLQSAVGSVKPSIGPWLDTARNFALFNNEGGDYNDLLAYLQTRRRR